MTFKVTDKQYGRLSQRPLGITFDRTLTKLH